MSQQIPGNENFSLQVKFKSLSLEELLRQQLLAAVSLWEIKQENVMPSKYREEEISLYRIKNDAEIIYRSRLSCQLAKHYQLSPEAICQQLLAHLLSLNILVAAATPDDCSTLIS